MRSIGDRIKEKRKELGLTQLELAEKLNVTDRAVSKWEQGEGDPSIAILPELAKIFSVSLDYLMIGKQEETISLDDMDDEKRALYFIKNDDVENFKKYGYLKANLLFKNNHYEKENYDRKETKILEAIFSNESINIFTECLNESITKLKNTFGEQSEVPLLKCDLDKYIRMCAKANCVNGLKYIDLKHFAIGKKTDKNNLIPFTINSNWIPGYSGYRAYVLGESTLDYIFSYYETSKDVIDYMSDIKLYRDGEKEVILMADEIVCQLYKNGIFDKLEQVLEQMKEYNVLAGDIYKESLSNNWYTGKSIQGNAIYFTNNGNYYLRALVTPINLAFRLAKENKDFVWLKKFNAYNQDLLERIAELKISTLNEDEIKLMELEENKTTPLEDLISLKYLKNEFLDIKGLLNGDYGIDKEDKAKRYKEKVQQTKKLEKFIKSHYTCSFELMLDCLGKKDNKTLFKFATDLQYEELQNAIIENDTKNIKNIAYQLFIPNEDVFKKIEIQKRNCENINVISGGEHDKEKTLQARIKALNLAIDNIQTAFISSKTQEFNRKVNGQYYNQLLNFQFGTYPLTEVELYKAVTLDSIQKFKQQLIGETIKKYEDAYEKVTQEKAMAEKYEKIKERISFEYLRNEVKIGNIENAIIKLCVRLEGCLKCKYKYDGDLFTMLDAYANNYLQWENPWGDDYDGENARVDAEKNLLHKLRLKRNNLVHAENNEVDFTTNDLLRCIEILENM